MDITRDGGGRENIIIMNVTSDGGDRAECDDNVNTTMNVDNDRSDDINRCQNVYNISCNKWRNIYNIIPYSVLQNVL